MENNCRDSLKRTYYSPITKYFYIGLTVLCCLNLCLLMVYIEESHSHPALIALALIVLILSTCDVIVKIYI